LNPTWRDTSPTGTGNSIFPLPTATPRRLRKKSDFDLVVKGRAFSFSRAVSITKSAPALQAAEKTLNSGGAVEERRFSAA
jgi:hypothetical protein